MAMAGFLPIRLVTSLFKAKTTSGSLFTSGPLALRESHFHGVLVPEQALSQGAVEMFNNGLVTVNVKAPAPDICFVLFHLFCDSSHEFAPWVNLQHLRPFQRHVLVNLLKGQGDLIRIFRSQGFGLFVAVDHVDNGQRVFEKFAPVGQFVVRQKKKVRLVDHVGCGNVEFRPRNSPRRGEEYLPERLLDQPLFCGFFRYLGGLG